MGGFIGRFLRDDVLEAVQRLRPIAAEAGLTMSQLALAWVLREDDVASAIIGASRPEQVHENAAASGVTLERRDSLRRSTRRWRGRRSLNAGEPPRPAALA